MTVHATLGTCKVQYTFCQETQAHLDNEAQRTGKTIEEVASTHVGLKVYKVKRSLPNHPPDLETF